ncbi:MAG: hypothetical protein JXB40_02965 [Candidatus Omnitrophica bacterium]|nr:hypothetical protein [Candidatus Omnitrophota bacterium]
MVQAKEPFRFYTRLHLSELTGFRASNLTELLEIIRTVSGSSIYHHTHRFLQQHLQFSPEPPNDFAYWVTNILGEKELGERLASIDTVEYLTLRDLRDKIAEVISDYLAENPSAARRFAGKYDDFYFVKSVSFILPTNYVASNLKEFADILDRITIDSVYFHIFEARLRLEKKTNDFSFWVETSIGDADLANRIARLDPYTHTLEDLRHTLIKIVKKRIKD